jgi:hypothetical protein
MCRPMYYKGLYITFIIIIIIIIIIIGTSIG